MSDLARALLDEIAADPAALARLRELIGEHAPPTEPCAAAYTVATLAVEVGRSPRSIRGAIARGELEAVKRGRGYVIGAEAVSAWASASPGGGVRSASTAPARSRRRSGAGLMRQALAKQARA